MILISLLFGSQQLLFQLGQPGLVVPYFPHLPLQVSQLILLLEDLVLPPLEFLLLGAQLGPFLQQPHGLLPLALVDFALPVSNLSRMAFLAPLEGPPALLLHLLFPFLQLFELLPQEVNVIQLNLYPAVGCHLCLTHFLELFLRRFQLFLGGFKLIGVEFHLFFVLCLLVVVPGCLLVEVPALRLVLGNEVPQLMNFLHQPVLLSLLLRKLSLESCFQLALFPTQSQCYLVHSQSYRYILSFSQRYYFLRKVRPSLSFSSFFLRLSPSSIHCQTSSRVFERCSSSSSASPFCFSRSMKFSQTDLSARLTLSSSSCFYWVSYLSLKRCPLRTPFSSLSSSRFSRSSVMSWLSALPIVSMSLTTSWFFLVMDCLRTLFQDMRTSDSFAVLANSSTQALMSSFSNLLFFQRLWITLASQGSLLATIFFSCSSSQVDSQMKGGQKSVMKSFSPSISSMFLATSLRIWSYFCISSTKLSNWSSMALTSMLGLEEAASSRQSCSSSSAFMQPIMCRALGPFGACIQTIIQETASTHLPLINYYGCSQQGGGKSEDKIRKSASGDGSAWLRGRGSCFCCSRQQ